MTGIAHTPGPWRAARLHGAVVADIPILEVPGSDDVTYYGGHLIAESIAAQNVALIAAAPDLLAALRVMRETMLVLVFQYADDEFSQSLEQADAAIAIATRGRP